MNMCTVGHLASIRRLEDGNLFGYVDESVLDHRESRREICDLLRRLADYVEDGNYDVHGVEASGEDQRRGIDLAEEAVVARQLGREAVGRVKLAQYTVSWHAVEGRLRGAETVHAARKDDVFTACSRSVGKRSEALFDFDHEASCTGCKERVAAWESRNGARLVRGAQLRQAIDEELAR